MLIAIVADTHFGYPKFYEDSMKQGQEAIDKACEAADVVLIAGDIFDAKVPKLEVLGRTMEIFETGKRKSWDVKSENGSIPIVAIHGTHERRSQDSLNPVQLLERSGFITNAGDRVLVFEKDGERVAIHGFGGVPDEWAKSAISNAAFAPTKGAFNIFVFHQTISDFVPLAKGIMASDLPAGYDLYVCGHLHRGRVDHIDGKHLIIPGSTVITQLRKEETEPKGFVLFDTKTRKHQFVKIQSRPFVFKEIPLKGADNEEILRECREFLDGVKVSAERPIVKIQLTGNVKEGLRRENIDLSRLFDEYGDKMILEIENSLDVKDLKEKLEEFRRMYSEKKTARELGIEILKQKLGGDISDVEDIFELLSDEKNIERIVRDPKLLEKPVQPS